MKKLKEFQDYLHRKWIAFNVWFWAPGPPAVTMEEKKAEAFTRALIQAAEERSKQPCKGWLCWW